MDEACNDIPNKEEKTLNNLNLQSDNNSIVGTSMDENGKNQKEVNEKVNLPRHKKTPEKTIQSIGNLYERQLTDERKEAILNDEKMKEYLTSRRLKLQIESIINEGKEDTFKVRDEKREKKLCMLEKKYPEFQRFCDYLLDIIHSVSTKKNSVGGLQ